MSYKTLTATILAAAFSTAAFAQTADVGTSTDTGVGVGVGAGNAQATAGAGASTDMAAKPNFGQVISGLNSSASAEWSTQLQGLGDEPEVQIITLSELKGEAGENSAALDEALARAETDVDSARTEIGGNAALSAALTAESYTPDDVVGVQVDGDSKVTLIVDDSV